MADVRVEGPAVERGEEILTPGGAGVRRRSADPLRRPPRRAAGRPRHPPGRDRRRPADRLPAGDGGRPRGRVAGAPAAARAGRPPGRDHRPDRAEDGDQRAQLRRERLAGRPRGRQHPALAQRRRRPGRAEGRRPPDAVVHQPGGQGVPAARGRRAADDRAPPARLAPARAAPAGGRRAVRRRPGRRRPLPVPQRAGAARPRQRPVLLPAEDGGPPRGPAVGAGLRPRRAGARPPGRLDPRHDADRDHPGGVRDGGDAARAGHPRRRAQRRPLGLPVQRHQGLPRRRARSSCSPTAPR